MDANVPLLVFVSMFAPAEKGGGIRALHLDTRTGAVWPVGDTVEAAQPFFLAVSPDRTTLYSTWTAPRGEAGDEVAAWRIVGRDGRLAPLGRQSTGGRMACYVETDPAGKTLLVANYSGSSVAALPLATDGKPGPAASFIRHEGSSVNASRQKEPHPHAIIAAPARPGDAGGLVYAADLGTDRVVCYRLDAARAALLPHDPPFTGAPPGSGPRHLRLHPDGRSLCVINELANTVGVYGFDAGTGALDERQMITTLPPGFSGKTHTADLRFTPDGRFLYCTNRGHDSIAIFRVAADGRLEPVEIVPSRGKGPQNLAITPDGSLLLCANMPGNNLVVFRIDRATGGIAPVGDPVELASPSCIAIVP